MRDVFANFVALLTHNVLARRCVFADLYTWFIYNKLVLNSLALYFLSLKARAVRRVCVTGVWPIHRN